MYRRLRCMKIFLSIYLVALKRPFFATFTDVTRPRARAEEDARSVHLLIGSMPAVSSGMRGRLSVSIHGAGRPRLPPALLSVRLHLSALVQTAGTCAALRPTRSSRAGSGQVSWAATRPC